MHTHNVLWLRYKQSSQLMNRDDHMTPGEHQSMYENVKDQYHKGMRLHQQM